MKRSGIAVQCSALFGGLFLPKIDLLSARVNYLEWDVREVALEPLNDQIQAGVNENVQGVMWHLLCPHPFDNHIGQEARPIFVR